MDKVVSLETLGSNVALIRMRKGENRFNDDFLTQFNAALDEVESDPSYHVLVTMGTGKFFSNGLDLVWMSEQAGGTTARFLTDVLRLFERVVTFPVPTVAAVNGHAIAGGAMLAMAHDLRVMREDRGWFHVNEIHNALEIPKPMVSLLRCKLPWGKAQRDIMLFGRKLSGRECQELGVVEAAVPEPSLLDEAVRRARGFSGPGGLDRDTLHQLKRNLYEDFVRVKKSVL